PPPARPACLRRWCGRTGRDRSRCASRATRRRGGRSSAAGIPRARPRRHRPKPRRRGASARRPAEAPPGDGGHRRTWPDRGWRTFLRLVICSLAVNNVIPGRPGEVLRGYWLGRAAKIPQARAFSTVVVDRSSDVLFLVAAFTATFPFVKHPAWLRHVLIAAI